MKKRKHVYGMVVLLLTAILFHGCPPEEIEVPEEEKRAEILNEKLETAVTLEAVATLKKFGMPIYNGVQPPNIEGSYLADDITLKVCKNFEDCSPVGTKYVREKWTLKNQDNERFSVNLLVENEDDDMPDSYNMIISGEGNKFTLYNGKTGLSSEGNAYRIIDVYSGTMTENGLTNVHFATLWIEEGFQDAAMIYHEQDGMAKKFDGPLEPEKPEPEVGEKAGSVKLPQGAKVNFEKYSVVSFSDKQKMTKKGDFVVGIDESEQLQQTVFMADDNNKVLMLAYLNVGEEEIELSAESSAIGMFMMITGARSQLDKEQWTRAEELLKKTPKFAPVLAEVERLIKEEADLLSEDNTRLISLYGELFESMIVTPEGATTKDTRATQETSGTTSQPFTQTPPREVTRSTPVGTHQPLTQSTLQGVSQSVPQTRADDDKKDVSMPPLVITNEGSSIIIGSNGTGPAYRIIIEEEKENGQRLEVLREDLGVSKAANFGITDILLLKAGLCQPPEEVKYTMKTNTNYYISANSGLGEWTSGSFLNIVAPTLYLADGLGWPVGTACVKAFAEQSYGYIKYIFDLYKAKGIGEAMKAFADRMIGLLGSGTMVECELGKGVGELGSKAAKFVLNGMDFLGKADAYTSLFGHFVFWFENESIIDFCRSTDGMDLNECGVPYLTVTTPLSIGTRVRLKCDRHACVYPAWIDLNGNDKKDPGEELEDGYNELNIRSVEMKIHGDFAGLYFEEMELTTLQLNPNSEVTLISTDKLKIFLGGECEQLKSLFTGKNLEKVDVRKCKGLKTFQTRSKLTELDLTGCEALEKLDCYKNELHTLDLQGLKALKEVDCYSNRLTKVQVGDNDSLVKVDLRHNRLDSMNIAGIVKNLPKRAKKDGAIIKLDGNTAIPSGNDYTSANLKNWKMTPAAGKITFTTSKQAGSTIRLKVTAQETNPDDVWVDLNGNGELDEGESFSAYGTAQEFKVARDTVTIYGGLLKVDCSNNEITWLEVNGCPTLQELRCNKNRIETLSIHIYIEKLKLLDCSDNLLKDLYVSSSELTEVHCKNNPLTELEITGRKKLQVLDLTNCASLTMLKCSENNLKTLTLTGCNALKTLNCYNNSLTALNVSGKTNLSKLDCRNNLLDASAITKVITDLPQRAEGDKAFANFEGNQAVPTAQDAKTAKTKNWTIIPMPEGEGPDNPDDPDNPLPNEDVIVFTIDKLDGTVVLINSLPGTEKNIWIDWNDSGIQDVGEGLFFNSVGTYPYHWMMAGIPSVKSLKIHGASFITGLMIMVEKGVNIVSIDIRKGMALREFAHVGSLETLHVKGNTVLQDITVHNSQLTSLDLTGCTALRSVSVSNNGGLTSLNLTGCTALESLRVTDNNLLTSIKLTDCKALNVFDIDKINEMVSLDLTDCAALSKLNCSHCKIDYLNASGLKKLETITFYHYDDTAPVQNSIGAFNLSNCTSLENIFFDDIQLASLDVSGCTALKYLDIRNNYLTDLDLSTCNQLESLSCGDNELNSLDLSTCNQLSVLGCGHNELTSLDLSNCPKLEYVSCDSNRISSLKLSGYKTLKWLSCEDNKLTSLNLSEYTALEKVFCVNNQLTSLLVSGNDREEFDIACWSNRIHGNGMEALINSLPDVKEGVLGIIDLSDSNEANVCTKKQVQTAKSKGWRVIDEKQNDYPGS